MRVEVEGVVVRRDWQRTAQCLHTAGTYNKTLMTHNHEDHRTPLKTTKGHQKLINMYPGSRLSDSYIS